MFFSRLINAVSINKIESFLFLPDDIYFFAAIDTNETNAVSMYRLNCIFFHILEGKKCRTLNILRKCRGQTDSVLQ